MILDDETLLSAYIDGELDATERHRVEMAMLADPSLAEQVRELLAVRDLVDSLPVPVLHVDVTAAVLAEVKSGRVRRPILHRPIRLPRLRTLVELAVAASVIGSLTASMFVSLKFLPPGKDFAGPVAVIPPRPKATKAVEPSPTVVADSTPASAESVAVATVATTAPPVAPRSTSQANPGQVTVEHQDHQFVREMLDGSNESHLFVVDVIGDQSPDLVGSMIKDLPRLDSAIGRISIRKGLVFDPKHPAEATVYAFRADEKELTAFREQLQKHFPNSREDARPDQVLLAKLADIPQVSVMAGTLAADLLPHPNNAGTKLNALRVNPNPKAKASPKSFVSEEFDNMVVEVTESSGSGEEGPTPEQMRSGPHPSNLGAKDAKTAEAAGGHRPAGTTGAKGGVPPKNPARRRGGLVLVWVPGPQAAR
ncbi:anti-sigma factor family protein [Singulisphaera sp. PoT]|uniref:anti-sigma factor family protein n=1 Tax=Singulisphaera sp. PoT TaxID=3411797 RepID=UPI003BF5F6F9